MSSKRLITYEMSAHVMLLLDDNGQDHSTKSEGRAFESLRVRHSRTNCELLLALSGDGTAAATPAADRDSSLVALAKLSQTTARPAPGLRSLHAGA